MAIENPTKVITKAERVYDEIEKGLGSATILKIIDPILENRLGVLLDSFESVEPTLGSLLDLRAKISEVWRMRRALRDAVKIGKSSEAILESMIEGIKQKAVAK